MVDSQSCFCENSFCQVCAKLDANETCFLDDNAASLKFGSSVQHGYHARSSSSSWTLDLWTSQHQGLRDTSNHYIIKVIMDIMGVQFQGHHGHHSHPG